MLNEHPAKSTCLTGAMKKSMHIKRSAQRRRSCKKQEGLSFFNTFFAPVFFTLVWLTL